MTPPSESRYCPAPSDSELVFRARRSGGVVRAPLDCTRGFAYGPLALEEDIYDVELELGRDVRTVIDFRHLVGSVEVLADDPSLEIDVATQQISGPLTVGGRTPPDCSDERRVFVISEDESTEIRTSMRCVEGQARVDMRLPRDLDLSSLRMGYTTFTVADRGSSLLCRGSARIVGDGEGLDLECDVVVISGELTGDGVPSSCSSGGDPTVSFEGAARSAHQHVRCQSGRLRLPPTLVPRGPLRFRLDNVWGQGDFSVDRLDTPLEFATTLVSGVVSFSAPIDCALGEAPRVVLHNEDVAFSTDVDCADGSYEIVALPGTYTLLLRFHATTSMATGPLAFGDIAVGVNDLVRNLDVEIIEDDVVSIALYLDGVPLTGDAGEVLMLFGGSYLRDNELTDGARLVLPTHAYEPRVHLDVELHQWLFPSDWSGDFDLPRMGEVRLNKETSTVAGRITFNGAAPAAIYCNGGTIGLLRIGTTTARIGCDGTFGPAHVEVGAQPVVVTFNSETSPVAVGFEGPWLRVP